MTARRKAHHRGVTDWRLVITQTERFSRDTGFQPVRIILRGADIFVLRAVSTG